MLTISSRETHRRCRLFLQQNQLQAIVSRPFRLQFGHRKDKVESPDIPRKERRSQGQGTCYRAMSWTTERVLWIRLSWVALGQHWAEFGLKCVGICIQGLYDLIYIFLDCSYGLIRHGHVTHPSVIQSYAHHLGSQTVMNGDITPVMSAPRPLQG